MTPRLRLGLFFGFIVAALAGPAQAQTTKITFAQPLICFCAAPVYAADTLGYFKEEGLEVEIVTVQGSSALLAAVNAGSAQFGITNGLTLLAAIPKGLSPVAVVGMDRGQGGFNMVVSSGYAQAHGIAPNSDWRTVMRKLAGARIGVLGTTSTGGLILASLAKQLGLPTDSYKLIAMTPAASNAALSNNAIDAWWQTQPPIGGVLGFRSSNLPRFGTIVGNIGFTTRDFIAKNPDAVAKFARAIARADNALLDPKMQDRALEAVYARMPGVSKDEVKAEVLLTETQARVKNGELIPAAFGITNQVDVQLGLLDAPLNPDQLRSSYTVQFVPKTFIKP